MNTEDTLFEVLSSLHTIREKVDSNLTGRGKKDILRHLAYTEGLIRGLIRVSIKGEKT